MSVIKEVSGNGVVGINMSWVGFFSKIDKRSGTFIPDSRDDLLLPAGIKVFKYFSQRLIYCIDVK